MALAIIVVPTLHGEVAKKVEAVVKKVETNSGTQDYSKKAKVVKEYLQKIKLCVVIKVLRNVNGIFVS